MNIDPETLKALTAIFGSVAVIVPILPSLIRPSKSKLRLDIEILNMLQTNPDYKDDPEYKKVKIAIDDKIREIYSPPKISPLHRVGYAISGLILMGFCGTLTYHLVNPFNIWSILTANLTLVGSIYFSAGILARGKLFEIFQLIPKTV